MNKKTILITYTNTGAGHVTPAKAIADRIEELFPNKFNIITSNFFEEAGAIDFNRKIEKSWDFLLKQPVLTKCIQTIAKLVYPIAPYYIQWIHPKVFQLSIKYIESINPDLIFSTHFFCHSMAIEAKKILNLSCPIIGLNPDTFDTFPQWDKRGDLLLVCSDLAFQKALHIGYDSNTLRIVPQPLRKEFNTINHTPTATLRKEYHLRPEVFTIFMSDGGQGVGKSAASIKYILRKKYALNIIIICGKNNNLYQKMLILQQKLKQQNHPTQIFPFSFVDSITPFIQMSDLFIGKSGPATIWECLKLKLPVIINFSANDAERITAQYFIKKKVALSCAIPFVLPKKLQQIIQNPSILQNIKTNIDKLDLFQDGSTIIAELLVDALQKNTTTH